ncbi:MAG: hypothetical protein FVQ80_02445 [Planctomycetes bacterium]|nr:hypothetical protein [Planctomycetota bacterium]
MKKEVQKGALIFIVMAGIFCMTASVGAVEVVSGKILRFSQFDLTFSGAEQKNSAYGLAAVDFRMLTSTTGISTGYLNISTSAGWVVQNMLVDSASGYPGSSTIFNLGNPAGVDVRSLKAYADFSVKPSTNFSGTPSTSFVVGNLSYNAQGRGNLISIPPPSPITPVIKWQSGGITEWVQQQFRKSVEQDLNQCGPASFANSLQYLEDEYGIDVPHDHKPGIDGDPNDSLVGDIDEKMDRDPQGTVSDEEFIEGKLEYIAENDIGDDLDIKHWGGEFLPGDRTHHGLTSADESNGISLMDWIIQEIKSGEDVELALSGGVFHWVNVTDAGKTLGIPWISWTHDANQGTNDDGTTAENGGTKWYDGGVGWSPVIDGEIPFFFFEGDFTSANLDFAVSESKSEPEPPCGLSIFVIGLLGLGALFLRRRQSRQSGSGGSQKETQPKEEMKEEL